MLESNNTNDIMVTIISFRERNTAYGDLTGRFPHMSSRGNQYIVVIYDFDSNAILAEPIKSRATGEI